MGREIACTDQEIDGLVYELYGITDEERKIIQRVWRVVPGRDAEVER